MYLLHSAFFFESTVHLQTLDLVVASPNTLAASPSARCSVFSKKSLTKEDDPREPFDKWRNFSGIPCVEFKNNSMGNMGHLHMLKQIKRWNHGIMIESV